MEGRVHVCSWKKSGKNYLAWLKDNPKITASASSFEKLDDLLWERIMDRTGDGENVREYVPAIPADKSLARLLPLRIVSVSGNTHSQIARDAGSLYSGGICSRCKCFLGKRTDTPLVLDGVAPGYDAGFVWQKPFQFFSEDFLQRITKSERAQFEWRKVEILRRTRKVFCEMIPRGYVPDVAVKGLKFDPLRCGKCESVLCLHFFSNATPIYQYVCGADLPKPLPTLFAKGFSYDFKLCMSASRWMELVGCRGTSGMTSRRIGVVAEELRDRSPKMRKYPTR
jgi:hypothetical protein